jgi:transketolase
MRVDFVKAMRSVLAEDPRSLFISGDLGFNALEELAKACGQRFINAGVAEQGMVGLCAGLALEGFRPWVYSIAPFCTYRCFEQIRNDVCLHNLPVRVVGNGGGYTYGIMGSTHHALEDLGSLKTLPNMSLFFPCGNDHVAKAVAAMHALEGPSYLRLGISGFNTPQMKPLSEDPVTLTRRYASAAAGARWTVVGMGHGAQVVLAALAQHGLGSLDVDCFGVARFPFDLERDQGLRASVTRTRKVLVVEEHYLPGSMAESFKLAIGPVDRFEVLCPSYKLDQRYGSPRFHLEQSGVTPERVAAVVSGAGP